MSEGVSEGGRMGMRERAHFNRGINSFSLSCSKTFGVPDTRTATKTKKHSTAPQNTTLSNKPHYEAACIQATVYTHACTCIYMYLCAPW